MRHLFLTLALLGLLVGCSGNDNAAKKTDNQAVQENTGEKTTTDIANKTYPVRNENNPFVAIETDYGKMVAELYRDVAPAHADSFAARAREGFYDNLQFFRVIDNFMVQTGDPMNSGMGNAGYYLQAEFSDIPHEDGTLSMARSQSPNSASCQFFVVLARNQSTAYLDGKYTVFGHLISGYDVLHKIGSVEVEANPNNPNELSHPKTPVMMTKVYVCDKDGNPL
ncbi:MAG TPA: peptidylprolyl isomerase [candidate division Zixibacteria bacterium]|nr:peptidylprolyl isomerase [candidate division Zixibacteria bacterium]